MALFAIIGIPFALAPLPLAARRVPGLSTLSARLLAWPLTLITAALFGWLVTLVPAVAAQGALVVSLPWAAQLGLTLSLYLDGLALLFALVVTGVGAAVVLYTGYYFDDTDEAVRFYLYLMLFMGAMLGVVLAGNLITLFIAWELTSVTSFLLIGFKGAKSAEARLGAFRALVVTGGGGLALIVGLVLVGTAAGSFDLAAVLATDLTAHPWYLAIVLLLALGAFTKSAQWPFHFWLPGAMAAPSPASAYLHAATMVKAGVYLLARFYPVLGGTALWMALLTGFGLVTMLAGALLALRKRDLKALLAYTTVSWLGALVALIGLPQGLGIKAALLGILAHALYKAALFLGVGVIEHSTGTRLIDELGGLARRAPVIAAIVIVSALSMGGFPPLFGFVAKETLIVALIESPWAIAVAAGGLLGSVLIVVAGLIIVVDVFFGQAHQGLGEHFHAPPAGLLAGPGALAIGSLATGFVLGPVIKPLLIPIVGEGFKLALFPGFNLAFGLSMGVLALGALIFAARGAWLGRALPALPGPERAYDALLSGLDRLADLLLRSQSGRLRRYLAVILTAALILLAAGGVGFLRGLDWTFEFGGASDVLRVILLAGTIVSAFATVLFRRHLLSALAMGVMGYTVGALFLLEPAPDVALVSILVETLATVLLVLMLAGIDERTRRAAMDRLWGQSKGGLLRDALIAGAVGVWVTLFALAAILSRGDRPTVATWYLDNTLAETGVTDVVAAILTDFRGTDTLIEITVFGVAALSVLTLLALPRADELLRGLKQPPAGDAAPRGADGGGEPRIATPLSRAVAWLVLPFAVLISVGHILYGASRPGDGFTAGVVSGLAVALWYVVFGYDEAKARLSWLHPGRLIGVGLAVALANAALPVLLGEPFLALLRLDITLPAGIKAYSSLLFEVGIFLAVFGGVSVIMEAIAHPTEVEGL
ncbi:MAG: monovalent cation/H+ antiporter subunit A [Anaerolineae bacterium]